MKATRKLDLDTHRIRGLEAELATLRERNAVTRRLAGIVDPTRVAVRMSLEVERFVSFPIEIAGNTISGTWQGVQSNLLAGQSAGPICPGVG